MSGRTKPAVAAALFTGGALWLVSASLAGTREAWDSGAYWALAYPVAIALCAVLGVVFPDRPWRWAPLHFLGQFLALCLRNGELGNLWPLGLIVFGVISLPGVLAAMVAARLGRARSAQ